ncbi:methionyl-tRNA formyltransferase [Microcella alkalica]|uniref:methionyl-tRNA formyltransferase n=1 Tax=Microcella alkalica TaxID=355930 RepID=UPI0015FE72A1|nr:methionyl-tRNA formyltransferase [Microcella alkalica]
MRLVVAGSPAPAVPTLDALAASEHEIVRVISRPPAPLGRRRILTPTPVAARAVELGIPVLETTRLADLEPELLPLEIDLGIIVAYGGLVREPLLSWPRLGWINLHFSLLPRWRGAAPVQHAIIAGDEVTGATVFQLTPGLDEGDWFAQEREMIGAHRTAGALLEALSVSGAALTRRVVDGLAAGAIAARRQEGEPTFAPKLTRDDARIRWTEPVEAVHSRVRGVTPEPGAFSMLPDGTALKILEAAPARDLRPLDPGVCAVEGRRVLVGTATAPLELVRVQPAGRSAMSAGDWVRGLDADSLPVLS